MDQRIIDLYDDFTHGGMSRRSFIDKLAALAGSTAAATALLPILQNNYAQAQTVPENDPRITAETVDIPGTPGLKGYLVKPKDAAGKLPTVIVIHENRGLNPHIKDVTRRMAAEGFIALGVDYLSPMGGTPTDEDKGREMIGQLKQPDVITYGKAAVAYLKGRPDSNGKVGAIGFCWGGGAVNNLAVNEPNLNAGVAYYGGQPKPEDVPKINAAMMMHYGGLDERINAGIPAYEAALKQAGKTYEIYVYEGANHAFNNDTNAARYDKEASDLAWRRTVEFLKKNLA
ncbi:dienelactone hydrolase family protein [Microvirga sp. 3-52]|jgi:carboxymethylenebutenolidase|uniref:dienelactone hydrolase family protein n=1 Tax=Microvirga sp. 3-52 TaxID=2792425 RepID=UPI001ACB382E|nr:dienelactone hydrolase family protein [Microvirga sp. 3-52]MBO1903811.1 dienelactone hydrolase family protein [Microvirga sp. 3-52]MBS7451231.1 dienelactone hydrolase family protein [Microvirga sp. 3-52]